MIGQRINNYEIVSLLGEGGMGAVYLARHPVIDRQVAVKVLRPSLAADSEFVARFLNEARASAAINHPNIVQVLDVGTLPGTATPFLMMELLQGESLARRIKRQGRIRIGEAVDIAYQTAGALLAAHAKGIVHRDLKPDNLYLVPDTQYPGRERAKVLDFGIAKLHGDFAGNVKTQTGQLMGTPPYMSPEQCRGVSANIDHRTDIYALGIILYEMLCGATPFTGQGFGEILVAHLTQDPPPLRIMNAGIPEHLERTVMKALAKKADERYSSMAEVQAALSSGPARTEGWITALVDVVPQDPARRLSPSQAHDDPALRAAVAHERIVTQVVVPGDAVSEPKAMTTFSKTTGELGVTDDLMGVPASGSKNRRAMVWGAVAASILGVVAVASLTRGPSPVVPLPSPATGAAPSDRPLTAAPKVALPVDAGPAHTVEIHPAVPVPQPPMVKTKKARQPRSATEKW